MSQSTVSKKSTRKVVAPAHSLAPLPVVTSLPITPVSGREIESLGKLVKVCESGELDHVPHVVPTISPLRSGSSQGVSSLTRVPVIGEVVALDNASTIAAGGVNKSTTALSDLDSRSASLRTSAHAGIVNGAGSKSGRESMIDLSQTSRKLLNIESHNIPADDPSIPSLRSDGFLCWFDQSSKTRDKVASALRKARKSYALGKSLSSTSYAHNETHISDNESGILLNTVRANKGVYFQCGVFGEDCIMALYGSKQFFRFSSRVMVKLAAARFVNVEFANCDTMDKDIYDKKLAAAGVGKMKDFASSAKNMASQRLNKVERVQDVIIRKIDRKRPDPRDLHTQMLPSYTPDVATLVAHCDDALSLSPDKSAEIVDHIIIAKSSIIWMNDGPDDEVRELLHDNAIKAINKIVEYGSVSFNYLVPVLTNCLERAWLHRHHGLLDMFESPEHFSLFCEDRGEDAMAGTLIEIVKDHKIYAEQGNLDYKPAPADIVDAE